MVSIIFIFCSVIICISLYFNNETAITPKKNMLLGVTLTYDLLENNDVTAIVKKYKKSYKKLILMGLILSIPQIITEDYPSLTLIYMFLWTISLFFINNKLYVKAFEELYSLKQKNNWFIIDENLDGDKYWRKGYYYNPDDKKAKIEKRIGCGDTYNLGNFSLNTYGKSKLYVYKNNPPYILIKLKDLLKYW